MTDNKIVRNVANSLVDGFKILVPGGDMRSWCVMGAAQLTQNILRAVRDAEAGFADMEYTYDEIDVAIRASEMLLDTGRVDNKRANAMRERLQRYAERFNHVYRGAEPMPTIVHRAPQALAFARKQFKNRVYPAKHGWSGVRIDRAMSAGKFVDRLKQIAQGAAA